MTGAFLTWTLLGLILGAGEGVAAHSATPLPQYRIGPEDVVQVTVWNNEALSRVVPVRPDGMISLPLLNDVPVAGLTPAELKEVLAKRLAEFVASPEVAVIVTEVHSLKVSVIGEVAHPGRYEFRSHATVVDVLAMAGGFTEFASRSRIVVLRPEGRSVRRIPFDYQKVGSGSRGQVNFPVAPGDTVIVP